MLKTASNQRGQRSIELGVDPELVDQVHAVRADEHQRVEAEQRERRAEEQRRHRRPGLAERRRELYRLARVVGDVERPERADLVVRAVEPVVHEVVGEDGGREHRPARADLEQPVRVERVGDGERDAAPREADDHAADAHRQARGAVAPFRDLQAPALREPELADHERDEAGDGVEDDVFQGSSGQRAANAARARRVMSSRRRPSRAPSRSTSPPIAAPCRA